MFAPLAGAACEKAFIASAPTAIHHLIATIAQKILVPSCEMQAVYCWAYVMPHPFNTDPSQQLRDFNVPFHFK
jgi:hypothetical protein